RSARAGRRSSAWPSCTASAGSRSASPRCSSPCPPRIGATPSRRAATRSTRSSAPFRCGRRSTSRTERSGRACRAASVGLAHTVDGIIRRHAMFAGGKPVLVSVSGGSVSLALLHVLLELAPTFRLTLHVLHVDHGLRAESARDAEFVRALGARL